MPGEVDRVLAGAAADFEHLLAVSESLAQHFQDRALIALAGFGERFHRPQAAETKA
jgi:hypothetical protein